MQSTQEPNSSTLERIAKLFPVILFAIAFGIRLIGIQWGLPNANQWFSLHPDEPVNLLVARNISVSQGQFDPKFYNYGTLYLTALSICDNVAAAQTGGENPQEAAIARDRLSLLYGRMINAVSGSICALFVFFALRLKTTFWPAAAGGLAMAITPAFVVHSRFATVDVFAAMLIAASQFVALKGFTAGERSYKEKLKYAVFAGALAGLSGGTKYNGILCILVLFVVSFNRKEVQNWIKYCVFATLASIIAFLIATPGAVINSAQFMNDFKYEMWHASTGHGLVFEGLESGFLLHVLYLLLCFGPISFIMSFAGFRAAIFKKNLAAAAIGLFVLIFYLLIGQAEVMFSRYTFPLYFGLAYGFGEAVHQAQGRRIWNHITNVAAILALGGFASGGLATCAMWTQFMVIKDPRQVAAEYVRGTAKVEETTVGLVSDPWFYSPLLYPGVTAPRYVPAPTRDEWMLQSQSPKVTRTLFTEPGQRFDWDVRLLDQKPNYVVYSSFEFSDLNRLSKKDDLKPEVELQVQRFLAFQMRLKNEYELAFHNYDSLSGVHDLEYIRPNMWIWKRKSAP